MTDNIRANLREKTLGDTAVDGLLSGFVAGAAMLLYLVLVGLLSGEGPVETIARFDPAQAGGWLTGLLAHLAVAGIYGLFFGLGFNALVRMRPPLARFSWLLGLIYGLLLYTLAREVILAAAWSPLLQLPAIHLAIAHGLYGLLLGIVLARR